MKFDRISPYNNLPNLPPSVDIESKTILKKTISANKALARMSTSCKRLPNELIFYHTFFLEEAKDSSEIENIVTTNDDLYQALTSERKNIDPNTKEVLHYIDALWSGVKAMQKRKVLTTSTFIKIVNTIKENTAGVRDFTGTQIVNPTTSEVIYTPPEGKEVILTKLKNLEEYININDGIDPLIKMAVIHYQFEAIHPFSDGNGRTGRILNILYLVFSGIIDHPMLFLSRYIIKNKNEYYIGLREVTESQQWEEWILYMLEAVETTSTYMETKINSIVDLMTTTKRKIRSELPKIYSKDLLEIIFQQPYCKISFLIEAGIAKRDTASKYLKELEKIGVLKGVKSGKEMLYVNVEFYSLLKG